MIEIDGSYGEGGGAILRQALGLSAYAGRAVRICNIRARRASPGLAAQHLRSVEAAGAICGARVRGASLGSSELIFEPGSIQPGTFHVDIGTAGSTTLVLQTILLPALTHAGEFHFRLLGGTDVAWSPPVDYFANVTLGALRRFGEGRVRVERRGYYPKGGGRVEARLTGGAELNGPLNCERPGITRAIRGVSHAAGRLRDRRVAERQADAADHILTRLGCPIDIRTEYSDSANPGSGITLWTETDHGPSLGGSALGARQKPADEVGREAARALLAEMDSGGALDRHLADQLIPFLAVVGGAITTSAITEHTRSNAHVAKLILGTTIRIEGLRVRAQPNS
jgi:RNA 3'-phosphate cyclase